MRCPACGHFFSTAADERAARREQKRDQTRWVRDRVMARSRGRCESCGEWGPERLELDHFFGRARDNSVTGCWALCHECHLLKTRNEPSRVWWLEKFRAFIAPLSAGQVTRCDALLAKAGGKHVKRDE